MALIGVWQMGESKRNAQESGAHSMTLLTAGLVENEDVGQTAVERNAMAGLVRASRLRFLAVLSTSNADNQDSRSPLAALLKPGYLHHFSSRVDQ